MRKNIFILTAFASALSVSVLLLFLLITHLSVKFSLEDFIFSPSYDGTCDTHNPEFPTIYAITPTYRRMEQLAELTRLANTFAHVKNFHWIVVEDSPYIRIRVGQILKNSNINYTYLAAKPRVRLRTMTATPSPQQKGRLMIGGFGKSKPNYNPVKSRGVYNRLRGLKWIRRNVNEGVLYFADDDNTYDVRLFDEMRYTCKVSMWPVGLVTHFGVSSPIIKNNRVVGFYDGWHAGRKFAVDMAGFAVNIPFFLKRPSATMPHIAGYEEDHFLRSLMISKRDIEPKASNCTRILVWHTKTQQNRKPVPLNERTKSEFKDTNIIKLTSDLNNDEY